MKASLSGLNTADLKLAVTDSGGHKKVCVNGTVSWDYLSPEWKYNLLRQIGNCVQTFLLSRGFRLCICYTADNKVIWQDKNPPYQCPITSGLLEVFFTIMVSLLNLLKSFFKGVRSISIWIKGGYWIKSVKRYFNNTIYIVQYVPFNGNNLVRLFPWI
jgi:hypothetical protein